MSEEKAWVTGKTALITTLVALALNPISVIVGYFLNESLSAPELSIQYVDILPHERKLSIDQPILAGVIRNPILKAFLEKEIDYNCDNWVRTPEISSRCIAAAIGAVEEVINQVEFEIEGHQANMDTIEAWDQDSEELILRPTLIEEFGSVYLAARKNKQHGLDLEKGTILTLKNEKKRLLALAAEFRQLQTSNKELRTGAATIAVGVLNSGNTDGAILGGGFLKVDGSRLALALPSDYGGSHPTVKAHTFSRISFSIDEASSSQESLKQWSSYLERHAQKEVSLRLNTTGGVLQASGRLPP